MLLRCRLVLVALWRSVQSGIYSPIIARHQTLDVRPTRPVAARSSKENRND